MSITTMAVAVRDFSARPGASDEHTLEGSVRSEQRRLVEKELPPGGLRRIWPVAALLVGHRSTSGYAPSSRLATGQIRRNERHRSYVHDHLAVIVFFSEVVSLSLVRLFMLSVRIRHWSRQSANPEFPGSRARKF